jgi:hypothetical protein
MKTSMAVFFAAASCMASTVFSADGPGDTYTATGILRISRQTPYIMTPPAHQDSDEEFKD